MQHARVSPFVYSWRNDASFGSRAGAFLALLTWIIEIVGIKTWAKPFVVLGVNPLFIYAASIVLDTVSWRLDVDSSGQAADLHTSLHEAVFAPAFGDYAGSLAYALTFLSLHWALAWWLYRWRIVIKV